MIAKAPASLYGRDPTPLDVVSRVAGYLERDEAYATLSSLSQTSKSAYALLLPKLYRHLLINGERSTAILDLSALDAYDEPDLHLMVTVASCAGTIFAPDCIARRIAALRCVQILTIRSFPDEAPSRRLRLTSKLLAMSGASLLPALTSVTLESAALDAIRTFVPESYDRPRCPALLEALTFVSSPAELNLRFRVVPSHRWEEHCGTTSSGAYNFVSRLNTVRSNAWNSLAALNVSGIVHQVLPSLSGCKNSYAFSPHCLYPDRMLNGRDGINIPGPHWSFRAWQLMTAIKNVFPSGSDTDPKSAMCGTSWVFENVSGHVLKKARRDGDDETGVGWDEVDGLVQGCIKASLPEDLPMRQGFSGEIVDEVLQSIEYA